MFWFVMNIKGVTHMYPREYAFLENLRIKLI